MAVHYLAAHRSSLARLYRQRASLGGRVFLPGVVMARLEQRLIGHAHAAGFAETPFPDDFPDDPADAFAVIAPILHHDTEPALARVADAFAEAPPEVASALVDAVGLMVPQARLDLVLRAFEQYPDARESLLQALHIASAHVPDSVLSEALEMAERPSLQAAALNRAAHQPDWSVDRFRPWYQGGLTTPTTPAALRAGLLRGDTEAADALIALLDSAESLETLIGPLHLNALLCPEHLADGVWRAADDDPDTGLWVIALSGRRDAAERILEALRDPRSTEPAAIAWQWLTGEALPRRDQLREVGAEAEKAAGPTIPDRDTAERWWNANGRAWAVGERRLMGGSPDPARAAKLAARWVGRAGDALLERAAMHGPGLYVQGTWFHRRGTPGPVLAEPATAEVVDAAAG